jgi:hypothetical protein
MTNSIDDKLKEDAIWSLWTIMNININLKSCWFESYSNNGMMSMLIKRNGLSIVVAKKVVYKTSINKTMQNMNKT